MLYSSNYTRLILELKQETQQKLTNPHDAFVSHIIGTIRYLDKLTTLAQRCHGPTVCTCRGPGSVFKLGEQSIQALYAPIGWGVPCPSGDGAMPQEIVKILHHKMAFSGALCVFYFTCYSGCSSLSFICSTCNELEHTGWMYIRSIHRRLHNALITARYHLNLLHDDLFAKHFCRMYLYALSIVYCIL